MTADPSGLVCGFADATGQFLPLACTLNAARVLDVTARMLRVDAAGLSDLALKAEILSYSNTRGIFAGASAEGGTLQIDWRADTLYYGQPVAPGAILAINSKLAVPESTIYSPTGLVAEFDKAITAELDYTIEAKNG